MELSGRGVRLGRLVTSGRPLFAYGTLQFPAILEVLLGRVPELVPTVVPGWRVAALPGRVYPGLVPAATSQARGVLLSGLTAGEWEILDAYEDDEYDLRAIPLPSPGKSAWSYVWTSTPAQEDWHPDSFVTAHLLHFVTRCAEWRRGF